MSDLYISPERIFLIYAKVKDVNEETETSLGYVTYELISATTNEGYVDDEIKKDPSGLMKKVINFQKEIVLPKTKFKLHGGN